MSTTPNLEEEAGTTLKEAEVEVLTTIISTLHPVKVSPHLHSIPRTNQRVQGLNVKSVENWDIKHWIAITGWTLPIKVDIHLQN